jgi:uncharacterized protein (DUF1330 family)
MAAYLIILREEPVQDPAAMAEYMRLISLRPPPSNLKVHALYGPSETVLGEPADGVVIMEFPSMEEAKAWYNSPEYSQARVHRHRSARHREIFVEGFGPPGEPSS